MPTRTILDMLNEQCPEFVRSSLFTLRQHSSEPESFGCSFATFQSGNLLLKFFVENGGVGLDIAGIGGPSTWSSVVHVMQLTPPPSFKWFPLRFHTRATEQLASFVADNYELLNRLFAPEFIEATTEALASARKKNLSYVPGAKSPEQHG